VGDAKKDSERQAKLGSKMSVERGIQSSNLFLVGVLVIALSSGVSVLLQLENLEKLNSVNDGGPYITIPFLASRTFDESVALFATSLLVLIILVPFQRKIRLRSSLNMPIVPSYWPFIGSALDFLSNSPWDLMELWHRQHGSIYAFNLLGNTCICIDSPDHLKQVLQSKIKLVKKDVTFAYKPFLPILGTGIVTAEGKSWMKQRRKISAPFKIEVLEIIPRVTIEAVQRLMVKMDHCAESEKTIDIAEELRHLTLQVISSAFLSLDAEESDTKFATMYLPIVEEGNKRVWSPERSYMFFLPFFWRHISCCRRLDIYVSKLITDRWSLRQEEKKSLKNTRHQDILDKVLVHYEKENAGTKPSRACIRQLRDEFKTFMLAGHETSAAMMTWTLFEIMKDDNIMEKVGKEADYLFGANFDCSGFSVGKDKIPSRQELSDLIFSESCLKEALRKYSVVPTVARLISDPLQIGPHLIPKGCKVMVNIQSLHRNPVHWPNPMKFDPTRFSDPKKPRPKPYTFLPFIDGPRNCLGQYLALLESKMVISLLVQRYALKCKNAQIHDGDPRHRYMVPIIPKGSVEIIVSKKFSNECQPN